MRIGFCITYILCFLLSNQTVAQEATATEWLSSRLTKRSHPLFYTQYFEWLSPTYFEYIEYRQGKYYTSRVGLSDIVGVDIVQADTALALLLTMKNPIVVTIKKQWEAKELDTTHSQKIMFPMRSYVEARATQEMFQKVSMRIYHLVHKQQTAEIFPDLSPLPSIRSRPFAVGKYPVTVSQYRMYCYTQALPMPEAPSWGWHGDHPIVGINWQEAQAYVAWLAGKSGLDYRLPSRTMWLDAALGDSSKEEEGLLDKIAWWGENAGQGTKAVGLKDPNTLGLYDMQGNVWEWLEENENSQKAWVAGGSWDSHAEQCQWNSLVLMEKEKRDYSVGFRVVMMGEYRSL